MFRVVHAGVASHFEPASTGIGAISGCHQRGVFYEASFLEYIRNLNVDGAYVDVGAHIGNHTIFFAQLCRASHVYAVEPNLVARQALEQNIMLNNCRDKVTVIPCAAGDTTGSVTINPGRGCVDVPVAPLDSIIRDRRITVLKIDIEGMESKALMGMRTILRQCRPLIFAEAATDAELTELDSILQSLGYGRTGRVFNATPTYEFQYGGPDRLRARVHPRRIAHGIRWRARRLRRSLLQTAIVW